ncbi:2,5-diamino-6-(ribosylamino)-4(3H)-pyrimidinone 5'-phosphate reductase [Spiromyces aspiralis]|uniref:2,5-diamino-6-(Ribosylamino)-4(3H)-pyrimidinone 5'-phosphate reductase n=1 Tax=Spiromyces aspiralis TaxID=68401 RepID=A0ACC1HEW7_9FUNG|nr:2,5-diamino-6-(ribosylamino)-4(3H)-pyrimidinone 5'-phosphate reductase [Spiromyces aspiralis]
MEDSGQGSSRSYHEVAREFVRRHIVDAHFGSARCSSSDDKHPNEEEADLGRPWVTVSFAQSLDGKLGMDGFQLALSSDESMAMTHQLRCVHDGILVGINTVINDDPRLTCE